jgi:hypothetical protein
MESELSSRAKIFRTFLWVIVVDLGITLLILLAAIANSPNRSPRVMRDIGQGIGVILGLLTIPQSLIFFVLVLVLLSKGLWERGVGLILGDLTMILLAFLICATSFR